MRINGHVENYLKVGSPISDPYHIYPNNGGDDHHDHDGQAKRIHDLLVGIAIGIFTVLLISFLYYLVKTKLISALRRRSQTLHVIKNKKGNLKDDDKIMVRRFEVEEVLKATKNFSEERLLGFGAFGNVYKATFEVEGTLAIKRPHSDSYQSVEEFRNEVRLLSRVRHRNLVGLVGFCEEPGPRGSKMLVYEYVPNGSLLEYITGKGGKSLSWRQRVYIAIGAARGIAYLHEGIRPSIIHRDIKPSNIMVGDGFEAKVSDFGLVRCGPTGDQSHVSSQVKGTPGYVDPHYVSNLQLTPQSDVFSFGVILLQLVTARPAIENRDTNNNGLYSNRDHIVEWARESLERGKVEEIIDANLLSEQCNMKMMLKMGKLGLRCVVKTPKNRPTMTQVLQELQEAFCLAQNNINVINKQPSNSQYKSLDFDDQTSSVSINGIGFQRFHVEMESLSIHSTVLMRCSSTSSDHDNNNNNNSVDN